MADKTDPYKSAKAKSAWTEERRKAQAERLRRAQPWRQSTGPKTPAGKHISARNAFKHGLRSAHYLAQVKLMRALLRQQKKQCRTYLKANMPNLALCNNIRKKTHQQKSGRAVTKVKGALTATQQKIMERHRQAGLRLSRLLKHPPTGEGTGDNSKLPQPC